MFPRVPRKLCAKFSRPKRLFSLLASSGLFLGGWKPQRGTGGRGAKALLVNKAPLQLAPGGRPSAITGILKALASLHAPPPQS